MEHLSNVLFLILFNYNWAKWTPHLNFQPDFNQFQIHQSNSLKNVIYSTNNKQMPKNFEWQSVSSVSLSSTNISYIVYGGSQKIEKDQISAFTKNMSAVFLCELKSLKNPLKSTAVCKSLKADDNNKYLGAAVKAISLSFKEAVVVYCDPLWHVSDKIKPKPSGKCYMILLNDENPQQTKSIEFCQLSTKSFDTCMGGFSIDLISQSSLVSGIEMIVGMPHMAPYGGVKIIKDPFGIPDISEPKNGRGKYFNYGYAVSMISKRIPYVSSPLSDQYGPNVTNLEEGIRLTSPDNNPFSSFGLSLITLSITNGKHHAVVVGAPFHTIKSLPNVGKVYIFCSSNSNRSIPSGIIFGQEKDEFLGYSLANIGDINYDGNDDLAISSPFLSHNDARGFVAIYTVILRHFIFYDKVIILINIYLFYFIF